MSLSTCPPFSLSPPRSQLFHRSYSNKHTFNVTVAVLQVLPGLTRQGGKHTLQRPKERVTRVTCQGNQDSLRLVPARAVGASRLPGLTKQGGKHTLQRPKRERERERALLGTISITGWSQARPADGLCVRVWTPHTSERRGGGGGCEQEGWQGLGGDSGGGLSRPGGLPTLGLWSLESSLSSRSLGPPSEPSELVRTAVGTVRVGLGPAALASCLWSLEDLLSSRSR